jgi:hypothetical protein
MALTRLEPVVFGFAPSGLMPLVVPVARRTAQRLLKP